MFFEETVSGACMCRRWWVFWVVAFIVCCNIRVSRYALALLFSIVLDCQHVEGKSFLGFKVLLTFLLRVWVKVVKFAKARITTKYVYQLFWHKQVLFKPKCAIFLKICIFSSFLASKMFIFLAYSIFFQASVYWKSEMASVSVWGGVWGFVYGRDCVWRLV